MTETITEFVPRRRPGFTLEQPYYTSEFIFNEDLKHVFFKQWLFAGHASSVPKPGDFFTLELGTESIIIIRDDQLRLHSLWNVCRHRGSQICTESEGSARSLVCPYHQWVYRPDGSLLKARLMPEDFDTAGHGLFRAHLAVIEGLIFVCLAERPPDFGPFRTSIEPRLRPHDLTNAKVCHRQRYEIHANWKLVVENSRECYHCGVAHPQYCDAVGFASAIGSESLQAETAALEAKRKRELQQLGLETEAVPFESDSWFHYRRFFLRSGFVTESMDGQPVAPLMGSLPQRDVGVFAVVTLPNLLLEASSDYVMTLRLIPKASLVTEAEVSWLVRSDAKEGADYDVDRLTKFWRLTSEQDWKLCEDNQKGVNSSKYRPGAYGPTESGVEHFVQWYTTQLESAEDHCGNS